MNSEQAALMKQLAGVWRLQSSEFRATGGEVLYPFGDDAFGVVVFSESGYMSAQIMRRGRPGFASGDQATGTPEEINAAFHGYIAYCGPCELDLQRQTVTTRVEGSLYPNWVGGQQLRFYQLIDDRLVLKTTPIVYGDREFTGVLTWKRD